MNGKTATATYGNGERYFYVSYTEFLRMKVILTYFCNGAYGYGSTEM